MVRKLWFYSIACTPIDHTTEDRLPHEMIMFCVDEQQTTYAIRVREYNTVMMILPDQEDAKKMHGNFENLSFRNRKYLVNRIETSNHNLLFRFSASKTSCDPHLVLKLFLNNEGSRKKLKRVFTHDEQNVLRPVPCIGEIKIDQFLHEEIKPEVQFLYDLDIKLHSWILIRDEIIDTNSANLFNTGVVVLSTTARNIRTLKESDLNGQPFPRGIELRKLYIRMEAYSSTATKTNQFDPSYDNPDDIVTHIALRLSDIPLDQPPLILNINDYLPPRGHGEEELLTHLGKIINKHNIHVIVFGSDEKCKPNALVYLFKRAQRYNINLHFSKMTNVILKCRMIPCGKDSERLEFEHFGTERMDICSVLPKAMVSPNLDGFTLIDALRHVKLVSKDEKKRLVELENLNYIGTNSFSTNQQIVKDLTLNVELLHAIEKGNSYVTSHQSISQICNVSLTLVCESGQQTRVRGLYFRKYHERKIVCNRKQVGLPYLVVPRLRKDSSYPNPPWLANPNPQEMDANTPLSRVFTEPLPQHLQFLMAHPHNHRFIHTPSTFTFTPTTITAPTPTAPTPTTTTPTPTTTLTPAPTTPTTPVSESVQFEIDANVSSVLHDATKKRQWQEEKSDWWKNKHDVDFKKKSRKKIKTQKELDGEKRYRGGIVLKPTPGFWKTLREAIITVDFMSLYPSIMEGYDICYMRVIFDKMWLDDPNLRVEYIPITDTECVVFAKEYFVDGEWRKVETVTPDIVHEIVQLRKRAKKKLESLTKGSFEYEVADSEQLSAKVIQNSVYGFTGSATSGMTCTALAAAITQIGQWMNLNVRFICLFYGHACYYGDTDSNMIRFWVPTIYKTQDEIWEQIFHEAERIVGLTTCLFPPPNQLDIECLNSPFLLLDQKKTYAAKIYAPEAVDGKFVKWKLVGNKIRGLAAKKRDKCELAQSIGGTLVNTLLENPDHAFEDHVAWFQKELEKIPFSKLNKMEQLNPFIITCALNQDYKQNPEIVKALNLAEMLERMTGARPRPGVRIPYVVANVGKKFHSQCCEIAEVFLLQEHSIDLKYYFETQIYNCVKQILSLPIHESLLQMFQTALQKFVHKWTNLKNKNREITSFFKPQINN